VFALFIRELRARVEGRWLGLLWTLFEPVSHMAILLLLFTLVRHLVRTDIDPALFLITGLAPFLMLRNIALRGADSVRQNFGLFAYRQVKPFDTLVSRVLVETTLHSMTYVTVLAALGWLGQEVWPHHPLELVAMSTVLITFAFGLGLTLMVACTNRPRVRTIVGLLFVPLYLMSGVIFPLSGLPRSWLEWLLLNPVLHLMELSRAGFATSYRVIDGVALSYPAAWAMALCALGMSLYRVQRKHLLASR
jgi:capsular polysaccharide transport system permease protein